MAQVVVVGAGLAGCAAALELAAGGASVALLEREGSVGGRVRKYGCKATDKCNNCGLCLVGGLWEKVENHPSIEILTDTRVVDVKGGPGNYDLTLDGAGPLLGVPAVLVATGFEAGANIAGTGGTLAQLHIEGTEGLVTGTELEELLLRRDAYGLFQDAPDSVAFIQCFGSRDKKEDAFFCSKVCCAYSTRAARVIRQVYPACEIAFFYMELQAVTNTDTFAELQELGVEFIPFRPVRIKGGHPALVEYEDIEAGMKLRAFDKVILSEGIHPPQDAARTADLFGLQQDPRGFLRRVPGKEDGVHLAGCARTPFKIEESYADGRTAARQVLTQLKAKGGVLA